MLLNVLRNVCSFRYMQKLTYLCIVIPLQPRILAVVETSQRVGNHFQRLGTLANTDHLTGFQRIRRDVYYFTVYSDVLVAHQLTGSSTRRSDTQTEYNIVQTAFEQLQQDFAGNTFQCSCLLKQVTELFFQYTVSIFSFLLLTKLHTVFRSLSLSRVTVLSGRIVLLRQNFICSEDTFTEFTGYS